jgi:hypothetical protein
MACSYWSNKPVKINSKTSHEQIISNKDLHKLITNDDTLKKFNLNVDYNVLENPESLPYEKKVQIVDFINTNYKSKSDTISLVYTLDILNYFLTSETLIIEYYPSNRNVQIGLIIGKKEELMVNGIREFYIEVNFLCLNESLRNLHASSIMINILTKECIERFNIGIAHYTIGKEIKSPSFCCKQMFHRPINVNNLVHCGFFGDSDLLTLIEKYNTWGANDAKKHNLMYLNGDVPESSDEIFDNLVEFRNKEYKIHDRISKKDILKTFSNKAFHHFMFRSTNDASHKIDSYFCFFDLKSVNNGTGEVYTNGVLLRYYITNTKTNVSRLLEEVSKKCYEMGNFDTLTIHDSFRYKFKNWLVGSGKLKYYIFNQEINNIEPFENGLVTI